jgi:hypothetical protein
MSGTFVRRSAGRAAGGRPYVQEAVSAYRGNQGVGRVKAPHTVTPMVRWADFSSYGRPVAARNDPPMHNTTSTVAPGVN